jgi:hypothetical protein
MTSIDNHDGMDDTHIDEETPPFALAEASSGPKHLYTSQEDPLSARQSLSYSSIKFKTVKGDDFHHQNTTTSSPPALVESMMTDGSSSAQSAASDSGDCTESATQRPVAPMSSTFLMSSLVTVHSDAGGSTYLPITGMAGNNSTSPVSPFDVAQLNGEASSSSVGFSQLMQAADDTNTSHHHQLRLGRSRTRQLAQSSRMPRLPEHMETDNSPQSSALVATDDQSGTLISAPETAVSTLSSSLSTRRWLPSVRNQAVANPPSDGLRTPLLFATHTTATPFPPSVTHLLSNQQPAYSPLDEAKATIRAIIEDDQAFEVSMLLDDLSCTVQDVMRIVGDPDFLRLWCDPIETLIVTRTSDGDGRWGDASSTSRERDELRDQERQRDREYEGEWIEATTTALGSPPSTVGFIYGIGQRLLESVGCASYGRVTMFVERRRGRVGLTVGPFHGCIHASHTITVSKDEGDGGRVLVVDRVRLTRDDEDASLANLLSCAPFESCLSRCMLPSVAGYLDQVTTSMARLRLLVERNGVSSEASAVVVDAIRRM